MIKNFNFQELCFALLMFLLPLPVLSWEWHFPFCPWRQPHRVTVIHLLPLGRGSLVFKSPVFCAAYCISFSECMFLQTFELWADVQLTWVLRHCGIKEFILAVITHDKYFLARDNLDWYFIELSGGRNRLSLEERNVKAQRQIRWEMRTFSQYMWKISSQFFFCKIGYQSCPLYSITVQMKWCEEL